MTLLAGAAPSNKRRQVMYGSLAIAGAISLHGVLAGLFFWQPEVHFAEPPAAAPLLFEVSMVAAPNTPSAALPVGLEQKKMSPAPSVKTQTKTMQPEATELFEPLPEIQSDVLLKTAVKKIEKKEPAEDVIEPMPEELVEKQKRDNSGEASGEEFVAESRAPLTLNAKKSEAVSAPQVGALSEAEAEAKVTWKSLLQAHLERRKRYPRRAQMLGQQGVPWVSFSVDRQGMVKNVELYRGSGYDALDKEVVALVYRAEPLPIPPDEVKGELLTMAVPVAFFRR